MQISVPYVFAFILLIVGMYLALESAWLKGRAAFVLTTICLLGPFAITLVDVFDQPWMISLMWFLPMVLIAGFCFYVVGAHYITRTALHDNTYQTRRALIGYIKRNNVRSPLAAILPALGPALLTCAMAYGVVVIWTSRVGA